MIEINEDELLQILEDLLLIHSPSKKEKEVGSYIIDFMENLGAEIFLDNSFKEYGGNCPTIFAKIKGNEEGDGVTFSAHMDVVEPNNGLNIVKEGNIWKSDGTTTLGGDDKAGLAATLYAIKYMIENEKNRKDIYAIFTPGEEIGMLGAKSIKWEEVYKHINPAKNVLVLDNAGRSEFIAYQAPTCYKYKMEIFGKTSHAGIEPEKGISAIKILSKIIAEMENGRIYDDTTANISKITSDFPTNVVPDMAEAYGEIRSHRKEKVEELLKTYEKLCEKVCEQMGGNYKFSYNEDYPALVSKDNLKFANEFKKAYEKVGVDAKLQIIGGGSDANFFAKEEFNSIVIGVGMQKVHTKEEYLEIDQLTLTTKAVIEYMKII